MEFAMFPTDKGESVSQYVTEVVRYLRENANSYQLTSMGSIIETETIEDAFLLIQESYKILDNLGCNRVYSSLKIDIQKGKSDRMVSKVKSVEEKYNQKSNM